MSCVGSKPSGRRTRLVDVAQEAGVSVQAVSLVLTGNTTARISSQTRSRILEAAEKVGYVPNRLAQSMRSGKTNIIAVWMPIRRPIVTYMRMLARLYDRARSSGYLLQIIGIDNDLAYKGEGEIDHNWPADGVIAIDSGKAIEKFRADRRNDTTPVGVLALEQYDNSDTVAWNLVGASRIAVDRMIQAGRKDVVFVAPQWLLDEYPREQRRRGYSEAMADAGLAPRLIGAPVESSDSAELAMLDYLNENPAPDGVFAFADNMAIGAARALLAKGLSIPADCMVRGFGDTSEAADFRVPLSTIQVPVDALVDQLWEWLLNRIQNPGQE